MGWSTTAELYWDYVISHETRISQNVIDGKKRSGKILQLWSIFPGVWMVWVGPKKNMATERSRKSGTWRLGESNKMLKCIWFFFGWWILEVPDLSICQLFGLRTCIFTVEQNMWPCNAVPPVDLQGGSTMTNWFSWSPGGVELRDFPIAMIIIFINEAPKKNPNHSARGFVSEVFKVSPRKKRKMNPSFDYHVFFNLVTMKFQNMGAPNQSFSFKVQKRRLQLVFGP